MTGVEVRFDLLTEFRTRHTWHDNVAQYDAWHIFLYDIQCLYTVGSGGDLIERFEDTCQHLLDGFVVFHYQHFRIFDAFVVFLLPFGVGQYFYGWNDCFRLLLNVGVGVVPYDLFLREVLVGIFETFYQVTTASDGVEALDIIQKDMPSIILSDVVMPRMSGTELCKQIKTDFNTCHIPVVLLTARTAVEHNIEGLKIGADDYITKPFNTNLLISRCNNLVNSRRLLQEKFSKQPQAFAQMLATNPMDKEMLDRAMAIIEQHLDNTDFNVNIFAREMGMARTNLFTKLKAVTGQTPNDFILSIRLKKGAVMLRNNPELNITEISDRIGFSSSRYFSKCFKEIYHVSPLAYRKGEEKEEEGNEETDQ